MTFIRPHVQCVAVIIVVKVAATEETAKRAREVTAADWHKQYVKFPVVQVVVILAEVIVLNISILPALPRRLKISLCPPGIKNTFLELVSHKKNIYNG